MPKFFGSNIADQPITCARNSEFRPLHRAVVLGKQGRPKKGMEKVGNTNISKGGSTRAYISRGLIAMGMPSWVISSFADRKT
jgi:hypothetical protein